MYNNFKNQIIKSFSLEKEKLNLKYFSSELRDWEVAKQNSLKNESLKENLNMTIQ